MCRGYKTEDLEARAEERARIKASDIRRMIERGIKICEEPDGPYMYGDMLESDLDGLEKVDRAKDYDANV